MMSIVGMIWKESVVIGYKKEITPSLTLGWKLLYVVLPPWIRHKKDTWGRICSVHLHPSASDVRVTSSVRIGTSATVLRIPMWCESRFAPLFFRNKTSNTTLFCSGTHVEDKADCIVGVYSYWIYNSNWIVCVNCHWVFPETTTATLALVCERME